MRKIMALALIAFALSALLMVQVGPAYAAQTTAGVSSAVSAVDTWSGPKALSVNW